MMAYVGPITEAIAEAEPAVEAPPAPKRRGLFK
jgi:hypothetical protein